MTGAGIAALSIAHIVREASSFECHHDVHAYLHRQFLLGVAL